MTDTLRVALDYLAYLVDPRAYPAGSALPQLIAVVGALQCVLAVMLLVARVRTNALFCALMLLSTVAVPLGLWIAGKRHGSVLTGAPIWVFCAVQFGATLYWFGTRRVNRTAPRLAAGLALFLLLALPGICIAVAAHLIDPAYRTY
jgi:hypothetical protein